jgi:hypothetical protein
LEDRLSDCKRDQDVDGKSTGDITQHLGYFYNEIVDSLLNFDARLRNLQMSKAYLKEALRIHKIQYGLNHPMTIHIVASLSEVLRVIEITEKGIEKIIKDQKL